MANYWGLPYYVSVSTNAYNTELLDKAGVQDGRLTSWAEVTEISQEGQDRRCDGVSPFLFQAGIGQSAHRP